jgi:hypothetical protein
VRDIAQAVRAGNIELFLQSMEWLDYHPSFLSAAMRAIAKWPCPSVEFRMMALQIWIRDGEQLRLEVDNDLVVSDALRAILPPCVQPIGQRVFTHRPTPGDLVSTPQNRGPPAPL